MVGDRAFVVVVVVVVVVGGGGGGMKGEKQLGAVLRAEGLLYFHERRARLRAGEAVVRLQRRHLRLRGKRSHAWLSRGRIGAGTSAHFRSNARMFVQP